MSDNTKSQNNDNIEALFVIDFNMVCSVRESDYIDNDEYRASAIDKFSWSELN